MPLLLQITELNLWFQILQKVWNISMSLSGDNEEVLRKHWEKLSDGGMVLMPLEKADWEILLVCWWINMASGEW